MCRVASPGVAREAGKVALPQQAAAQAAIRAQQQRPLLPEVVAPEGGGEAFYGMLERWVVEDHLLICKVC